MIMVIDGSAIEWQYRKTMKHSEGGGRRIAKRLKPWNLKISGPGWVYGDHGLLPLSRLTECGSEDPTPRITNRRTEGLEGLRPPPRCGGRRRCRWAPRWRRAPGASGGTGRRGSAPVAAPRTAGKGPAPRGHPLPLVAPSCDLACILATPTLVGWCARGNRRGSG